MFGLIEGMEKKTSYTRITICAALFAVFAFIMVRVPQNGFSFGTIVLDQATIRGLVVQLQMFISIYLVLKEKKPGFTVAVLLNTISLISALAYVVFSGTSHSLPGVISYAGVLAIISVLKSYRDRITADLGIMGLQEKREDFFFKVFEQAPIGIAIVHDKTFCVKNELEDISINPGYENILGREKGQLHEVNWMDITHPDDLNEDLRLFELFKGGSIDHYAMAKRFVKPNGAHVWVDMRVSPFTDAEGGSNEHICIITDITEQKKIEETLQFNNEHILLTGLYNRVVLERTLKSDALAGTGEKRALISVNLSGMDTLSLRYGFHFAQDMISKIADALKEINAEGYELYQSYENRFAYYAKDYRDPEELSRFARKVSAALFSMLGAFGVRYGIGIIEIDGATMGNVDDLLRRLLITSETAARGTHRNMRICVWGPDIDRQVTRESDISRALQQIASGIDEDRISLQFQPIWDASSDRIYTFEALARLKLEPYGSVPPDEFINIAEKHNLIVPLGEKIIQKALNFLHKLKENGHDMMAVSMNISLIQLLSDGFAEKLIRLIDRSQLAPSGVIVELTESVFSQEQHQTEQVIDLLQAAGIKIMIDDFGTGYSSFERLSNLNVDCLKIDKVFVDKLIGSKPENTIIRDMISMARKLGHCVVAEGVEHNRQLSYLLACDCDKIQGYLVSKPLDEDEAIAFLKPNGQRLQCWKNEDEPDVGFVSPHFAQEREPQQSKAI